MTLTLPTRALAVALTVALGSLAILLQPVVAISNSSSLRWMEQPATASVGDVITSEIGAPGGVRIKVAMFNGSGERQRTGGIPIVLSIGAGGAAAANLSGIHATTNSDGVAVFEATIDKEGFDYQLVAKAADGASVNSGHIAETPLSRMFDIRRGDITACSGECSDTSSQGDTQARLDTQSDGYLVLDVGGNGLSCAGGAGDSQTVTFDVVSDDVEARTRVTVRLEADAATKAAKKYDVCFTSPVSTFKAKSGTTIGPDETGILADCPRTVQTSTQACVHSRIKDRDGDIVVVFSVPPGDPRAAVT